MRAGFVAAWLMGMGIITWRSVACEHHPPIPGQMLSASGLFALLGLLAEYPPAAGAATMLAFGFDLAALLNGFPCGVQPRIPALAGLTGLQKIAAEQAQARGPAPHGPQNIGSAPTPTGA